MKLHQKLQQIVRDNGGNLSSLHRKIKALFEENAIAYLTLYRTVQGLTEVRQSTLFQIASALGMSPEKIKEGTEKEEKHSRYEYNPKAFLEIENNDLPFLSGRLILLAGASTQPEQDPTEKGSFTKWLYGLQGEISCVVVTSSGEERTTVRKNESFAFPSTLPHHFENNTGRKASCVLIQNPKYI